MLKRTFETNSQVRNFWVDKQTGNLFIQDVNETVEIPHEEAVQIILEIKGELLDFQESKSNIWDKFLGK